ncbi:MAG: GTPase [Lachnospiraceae bacterium]|nr:GTPase [Lachnospiraceae bacterium]
MEIPVFLFNGFLDSGKTTFVQDTIEDEEFLAGEKVLLITCEEGECEYDEKELLKKGILLEKVEDEEDFTPEYLQSCQVKYMPQKVMIEYNGMWRMEKIYGMKLPKYWEIVQVITTVDASTFSLYLNNMRSLIMEQFQDTDMVIFNRCDENTPLASYRRSVKAINPGAQVYMENADGSQPSAEDILPYDISKDTIELEDTDFGIWYVDAMDAPEKYDGKTIHMRVQVYKNMKLPSNAFVPGRFAMTCCADDIRFIGPLCVATPSIEPKVKRLKKRDWIYLTARIKMEYAPLYKGEGPVLYAEKIEPAQEAAEKVVYFN